MNKNFFLSLCGLFLLTALISCNDDNLLGSSIQPDQDKISVAYDTIHVKSETVVMDSVFLRNSVGSLGEFTDPTFGTTKADFMAQMYCARNFEFPDDVHQIDSAFIYMYYSSWFGDSTALHHVNVYELNNPLDENRLYYSNADVDKYCDKSKLIAQGSFTTGDLYSTDSVRALDIYHQVVKLPVDPELAQRFLKHPEYFKTPEEFQKNFNGVYVTTDYGNGSILYVSQIDMELCYDTWLYSASGYRDSLVVTGAYFPTTKEVKQVNRVKHPDLSYYLQKNIADSLNFIYTPAGMFTKVTIPESIFAKQTGKLSGKTISKLNMEVMATQLDDDWDFAMDPPEAMLLINAADAQKFFEGYNLNDGVNSFIANYSSTDNNYIFDLSLYAQKMIHKMDGTGDVDDFKPFTEMIMIPVSVVQNADEDNVRVDHVIAPCAVKIRSSKHATDPMRLNVVYTKSN